MTTSLVSINGRAIDYRKASISIFDYTLHCAIGLFESLLAVDDRPIFLKEHLDRMEWGISRLRIKTNYNRQAITRTLIRMIRQHPNRIKKTKVLLTYGHSELWPGNHPGPKTIIIVQKHKLLFKKQKLMISPMVITTDNPMRGIKSVNFMSEWMSQHRAYEQGYDQGIILNNKGFIAETGSANLFMVKNGRLYTPSVDSGGLSGVVRSKIIELARNSGIKCYEMKLRPEKLVDADEIFTTSSFKVVWPVIRLKLDKVYRFSPGPISKSIFDRLKKNYLTGVEKTVL
jgi:branched-subunit amino acid aminotransferase/4-amino-4-deoxychorismate lyase